MQPLRILMIDNAISHTKIMRTTMQDILDSLPGGGLVELATTAEEAQCLISSFHPNAITVNFAMSILRVADTPFVPWLVKTTSVPVIAYGLSNVLRDAAIATGVDAYFMRPTHRNDWLPFCSKLARFLRRLAFPDEPPIQPPARRPEPPAKASSRPLFHTPTPASLARKSVPESAAQPSFAAPPAQGKPPSASPLPQTQRSADLPEATSKKTQQAHADARAREEAAQPPFHASIPPTLRQRKQSKEDEIFALLARTALKQEAPHHQTVSASDLPASLRSVSGIELIAIGASTGGTDAIADVLHQLTPPFPPIVIVQHIPAYFSRLFAIRLNEECAFPVEEGETGMLLEPGHAYIAPGEHHMTVSRSGARLSLRCLRGPKIHSVRPSVDVLFNSVVKTVGKNALGVLLTGMGKDGAAGLLRLRKAGAPTIGQSRETCIVYGMPRVARDIGAVCYELPLSHIGPAIQKIIGRSH